MTNSTSSFVDRKANFFAERNPTLGRLRWRAERRLPARLRHGVLDEEELHGDGCGQRQ